MAYCRTLTRTPALLLALAAAGDAGAATLPAHDPVRILVIGDAVNPHNLPPEQLTEPADLRAALADPQSGINLDGDVTLVDSQCVDEALTLLDGGSISVVVYFAHRAARRCDNGDAQPALTAAFADMLADGRGIVVFHHGLYEANGKGPVLQLLGGTASSIAWNTMVGQRMIATAPGHFVVDNGVAYSETVAYEDAAHGVPAATYDAFVTVPDERYPNLDLLSAPGEDRTILFASDYDGGGATHHVLGYDLQRQGWAGRVVFLQPGEYQPKILDIDGNPFQVLANAVVYAAGALQGVDPGTTGDPTTGDPTTGDPTTGGSESSGGTTQTSGTSGGSESSGGTTSAGTGTGGGTASGGTSSAGTGGSGDSSGGATADSSDDASASAGENTTANTSVENPDSCKCVSDGPGGGGGAALALLTVVGLTRRRRA